MASPSEQQELADELEYRGETAARHTHVATLLAMACPGIAYAYIGRVTRAVTVNFAFVLGLMVFVILMSWIKFFPLLPALVFGVGWFVFAGLCALDVREIIADHDLDQEYLLQSYNHWLPYSLMAILTFVAPIAVIAQLTESHLVTAAEVPHDGMYPTMLQGDIALIDRTALAQRAPKRGDIVAVSAKPDGAPIHMLRVVGVAGDIIRVEGDMLYVDEEPVEHVPFELDEDGERPAHMLAMVEHNRDESYLISMARGTVTNTSTSPKKLKEHQIFLLADNRSQVDLGADHLATIRDSRNFGPLSTAKILGIPRYILWSQDPATGTVRWRRIGLRVQ